MFTRRRLAAFLFASAAVSLTPLGAQARPKPRRRPDLADAVQGDYDGNVTSDMDGPPKNSVAVTVTRIGPNRVRITSDYPRVPSACVSLTRAGGRILNPKGRTSLMYDPGKSPPRLELTFSGEVSWDGKKL
jgi:hypothetical protein